MFQVSKSKPKIKGFTLLELLIVIAILAILATTVILIMNPAESIKRARDTQRISDLDTLKTAITLWITEGNTDIGASTCDNTPTCYSNCHTDSTDSAYKCTGFGAGDTNSEKDINGNGWIPIDFSSMAGGSVISSLPTDPVNSGDNRYIYAASGTQFELNANMESSYYTTTKNVEANDGGNNDNIYEVGTKLDIIS